MYIPVLWASLSAPIPRRFKNQSLGFLDLILRREQIKHYLLFWTYFAWVIPWEIFQVLLSTSFLSSVQFSRSVMSDSLRPCEMQHTRPPCPSPTPGVHPNPCPWSRWCHPTISSSVIPFSCPQSFPASGSFPMSQLFASGGQSTGVSASTSVLPMNTQDLSPLG